MSRFVHVPKFISVNLLLNTFCLLGICIALFIGFYYQLIKYELPCPLCLLQRIGLIITGCAFLFNVWFGIKNIHYGMVITGCIITGMIAMRQVLMHIMPGDPGFGTPFLGVHFYTWALIISFFIIIAVSIMIMASGKTIMTDKASILFFCNKIISYFFVILVVGNIISTILECGNGHCVDNPISYLLLVR